MNKLLTILFFALLMAALNACRPTSAFAANVQQDKLNAALLKAVESNNARSVSALLKKGADANAKSKDGEAALKVATRYASIQVVKLLLWRGADVNARTGVYRGTALIYAAERGDIAIIRLLLKRGADVNAKDDNDRTALWSARDNHHYAVASLLTRAGARKTEH